MSETASALGEVKWGKIDYLLLTLVAAVMLSLFFHTLQEIALICWRDDDYSHGLLLPLIAVYMIWDRRGEIARKISAGRQSATGKNGSLWLGAVMLLGGMFLYFLALVSGLSFFSWLGFFPAMLGVVALLFGRTTMFCVAPAILLLLMAKPMPDSLVVRLFWPLQVFAARFSAFTLRLLDVPVHLSGNIIEIPAMRLMVEEACSGMRSVMALLTLAFIVNFFLEVSIFSKIALVAASLVVAIVMNVLRVAMTGVLAHFYDPASATGFFHTFSGLIVFIVGLPILYFVGQLLLKFENSRLKGA